MTTFPIVAKLTRRDKVFIGIILHITKWLHMAPLNVKHFQAVATIPNRRTKFTVTVKALSSLLPKCASLSAYRRTLSLAVRRAFLSMRNLRSICEPIFTTRVVSVDDERRAFTLGAVRFE